MIEVGRGGRREGECENDERRSEKEERRMGED